MVRRLKSELKNHFGTARFPERKVLPIEVEYTKKEERAHAWLQQYSELRARTDGRGIRIEAAEKKALLLAGGFPAHAGKAPRINREEVKGAFQTNPAVSSVRILLATDAASEGLDLQNYCNRLIHYEIPWNPNRLEQRNGRLDRHGQKKEEVLVHHFVSASFKEELDETAGSKPGDLRGAQAGADARGPGTRRAGHRRAGGGGHAGPAAISRRDGAGQEEAR